MTIPKLNKGVGYIRRSSHKQLDNHSIEIQKREIEIKAKAEGYEIIHWCIDDAVSAYRKTATDRPGMRELFMYIINNEADAVFFYEESRIDRTFNSFVTQIYNPIKSLKPNCKFFCTTVSGEWDAHNTITEMKLLFAGQESIIKSKRTKDTQDGLLAKKIRPGSRTPFGYKKVTVDEQTGYKTLIPDENAPIVLLIFYLSSWGYSNEKIANLLNECNVPSPSRNGWHENTIDAILHRYIYAGHLTWNVRKSAHSSSRKPKEEITFIENVYEPIVPPHLWHLVNEMRELKKQTKQFDTPFYLRGIAYCKNCKVSLKTKVDTPSQSTKKYMKYVCPNSRQKIDMNAVHEIVFTRFSTQWTQQLYKMRSHAQQLLVRWKKALRREEESSKKQNELLLYNERMIEGNNEKRAFLKHISSAKETMQKKLAQLHSAMEQIDLLLNNDEIDKVFQRFEYLTSFGQFSDIEKRTLSLMFINRVDIHFASKRVDIDFRLSPFVELEKEIKQLTEKSHV